MRAPAVVACVAALALPPGAGAAWSHAGGGPGRSGTEAAASGGAPFGALWTAPDEGVATPVILGDGPQPRAAYATRDGRLHVRDLLTGEPVGDPAGVPLTTRPFARAVTGVGGSVPPVSSSGDGAAGQLFAVVNDPGSAPGDGDLLIVQVDEVTGRRVREARVPGSAGQQISSAPLLTAPAADGRRGLIFTSIDRDDWEKRGAPAATAELWRVPIRDAQSVDASLDAGAAERGSRALSLAALNPLAAPTLLTLGSRPLVVVASGRPTAPIATLDADGFCSDALLCRAPRTGPGSARLVADAQADRDVFAWTASAPANSDGVLLFATYDERSDRTLVHRLAPAGDGLGGAARSAPLLGRPGPGLATTVTSAAGDGTVVVTTGRELAALDGRTLAVRWRVAPAAGLTPGGTGFGRTAASIADGVVFAARDDGRRVAFRLDDGTPVAPDRFDAETGAAGTRAGVGSPAVSPRGIVVFATDTGVVALRDRCGSPSVATSDADEFGGTPAGDRVGGGAGADHLQGAAGDDCLAGGADDDQIEGEEGDDRLTGGTGVDTLDGGPGADGLKGDAGNDTLGGGNGTDTVDGGGGSDVVNGDAGADVLTGGPGNDVLLGAGAGDGMAGGAGDDRLDGGTGADRLRGGRGRDVLRGRAGNDRLDAGPGGGSAFGGTGDDRITTVNGARDVVDCGPGQDVLRADPQDVVRRCERVVRVRRG